MQNKIWSLYNRLKRGQTFAERYPHFDKRDGKRHVLFFHCTLDRTGLYRVISPAEELNNTSTHSAIIANAHRPDFKRTCEDYDNPIDRRLIEWADIVVFPLMQTDLRPLREELLAINPHLNFSMDIPTLPARKSLDETEQQKQLQMLSSNVELMDMVSFPSKSLMDFYKKRLLPDDTQTHFTTIFDLLNSDDFSKLKKEQTRRDVFSIGIPATLTIVPDALSILEVLKIIHQKHQSKVEFVLIGWNGFANGTSIMENIPVKAIPIGKLEKYHTKVNNLNLDLVLLPTASNVVSHWAKSSRELFEFSALGVPVITQDSPPYSKYIVKGQNGFLANNIDDWISLIEKAIKQPQVFEKVGQYGQKMALKTKAWTRRHAHMLAQQF